MSLLGSDAGALLARSAENGVLSGAAATVRLIADSSATGGALSTVRVALALNVDGAAPHTHTRSSEMFYVLSGAVAVLSGEQVLTAHEGDLIVVPPNLPHAFAAARDAACELLIVITPGVERFEYFRQLGRIASGLEPRESLLAVQELYDTYFLDSVAWRAARDAARPR
jgi:mannose-6-phosphate isomerase-like protein (cupin superfamily)